MLRFVPAGLHTFVNFKMWLFTFEAIQQALAAAALVHGKLLLVSMNVLFPALPPLLLQTLITAVSQVGVDINAICANPWRQAPLQFVPGLGPRKARQLLASIAANDNHVKTRMEFFKQVGLRWQQSLWL